MGLHGSHTWEIFFEDCEVPVENMLGEEGQGYVNALKILANGQAAETWLRRSIVRNVA